MNSVWALVEWVDENNVFTTHDIVNFDTFSYQNSDFQPGKQVFISVKNSEPRRAKIIRISDNKHQLKEHKDFLERQDQQVKNVLQLCMRTIKEMKSESYSIPVENNHPMIMSGVHVGLPRVLTANSESSLSYSDTEIPHSAHQPMMAQLVHQTHQNVRYNPGPFKKELPSPNVNPRRRSVVSSTPLPGKYTPEIITLCFDQGTQTDADWPPAISKIEELELVLKHLYGRFQSLIIRANSSAVTNGNITISEVEQNGEASYIEPNDSLAVPDHFESGISGYNTEENIFPGEVAEQVVEIENQNVNEHVNETVKIETVPKNPNESTRVRRMSAHTTYSDEMVSIGYGRAKVPSRVLSDIDWTSYTSATRQLLQAIFPRRVLATHSLTGKPSPAHLNKPPKKILNPTLVEDIILMVSSKCGVPKNLVRNCITVKCTDEAKLFRNRQQYRLTRKQQKRNQNDENAPPAPSHSLDDTQLKPL